MSLTLPEAVRMALDEGANARLARTRQERAEVGKREALQGLMPQVSGSLMRYSESINLQTFGFATPGEPPVVGPFDVSDAQLNAAMQLFNLAAIRRYQALRTNAVASKYQLEQTREDVVAAVARLYVLVQKADAQVATRQSEVSLFETLLKVARDEFQAGTGTKLDVAQANVQLSRAKQGLLVAESARDTAKLALLGALGADEGREIVLTDSLPEAGTVPEIDAALETARSRRPELKEVDTQVAAAKLQVEAMQSRRLPSLAVQYTGDYSGNTTSEMFGTRRIAGVVSVPLFDAQVNAKIATAKLDLQDVKVQAEEVGRQVERQVRGSLMSLRNAQTRVEVAAETVKVADEALTIARDRRAAGYGSSVEVDRAQESYAQAHEDLISARADAAMAMYELQHATGEIGLLQEGSH
ncbi:MAG: TolC family protein [Thermoanaerobaculia bacterium]